MVKVPFLIDEPEPSPSLRSSFETTDPRIIYLFALADDMAGVSIFQSFHEALLRLHWAFEEMVVLPATIFEPVAELKSLIALRACGLAGWRYQPLPARAVPYLPFSKTHPFFVVFSDDPAAARDIARAFDGKSLAPFHISSENVAGAHHRADVSLAKLQTHFLKLIDNNPHLALADMRQVIAGWKPKKQRKSSFDFKGNYTVLPNQMTLRSLGVVPRKEVANWSSDDPTDYLKAILESAAAVDVLRNRGEIGDAIRLIPPRPDTWLVAPSLEPDFKRHIPLEKIPREDRQPVRDLIRMFERQRVFGVPVTEEQMARMDNSKIVQELRQTRNLEAKTFAAAVGVAAAGTMASVYRLTPGVERVAGKVRQFADNVRAEARTSPPKVAKLFADIQTHLGSEVAPEILERIAESTWGIKAVTNAPLEWLPVNGLPLGLLRDVSRIPATPGDLAVKLLAMHEPIRIPIEDFSEILVISAFEDGERFDMMRKGFDATEPGWAKRIDLKFVRVGTKAEFIKALDDFRGPLLIFDGHGSHPVGGRGRLILGKEELDIWSIPAKVRVPPIVILSACDTHAADRSWSTVSNAFLHLGARTVLATMLPIGVREGAIFSARLIFRLAAFLPVATGFLGRVVRWSEVVGGMLRMQLLTDILKPALLADKIRPDDYHDLLAKANFHANGEGREAIDYLEREVVARGIFSAEDFREVVTNTIPGSDTIRYAQMGNPETILIGSIEDLPAELQAQFEGFGPAMAPIWRNEHRLDMSAIAKAAETIRRTLALTSKPMR